jgi:peptide-methionine (R)-S-oxide reductase
MCILFALLALVPFEWNGEKVSRSEESWLELLGSDRYAVMRERRTERAFSGKYRPLEGVIYSCAACGLALFDSKDQYNAGNGYPSFKRAIVKKNIYFAEDRSLSFKRYEVLCRCCDSHLGHVFKDGPPPKGLRFSINSITLNIR